MVAALIWAYTAYVTAAGITAEVMATIVSLSGGALLANMVSVTLLVAETIIIRR